MLKGKTIHKIVLIIAFLLIILFFTITCSPMNYLVSLITEEEIETEQEYPLGGPIPQSEIVFMPDSDPISANHDTKSLGFINADGGNRQEYTFTLIGGSLSNFGKHIPTQYASLPRWSISGDELLFGIKDLPPNIRLVNASGKMYGQDCLDVGYGGTFDLQGNIFIIITKKDPLYADYMDTAGNGLIARYDLKSCHIIEVFSVSVDFLVGEIQEAENGLLVAAFWDSDEDIDKILIYDQTTGESQTMPGYHPSLSEDGTMLVYYNMEGALVIRDIETGEERMLKVYSKSEGWAWSPEYISMPGWSPDNKWLVYNTPEGEIYKINIETKENIYLTYGWAPDWK